MAWMAAPYAHADTYPEIHFMLQCFGAMKRRVVAIFFFLTFQIWQIPDSTSHHVQELGRKFDIFNDVEFLRSK